MIAILKVRLVRFFAFKLQTTARYFKAAEAAFEMQISVHPRLLCVERRGQCNTSRDQKIV